MSETVTPESYIQNVPQDKQAAVARLHQTLSQHLPQGFEATIGYKMLAYVVPKNLYPNGYHCDPKLPLPFINVAAQKNFIALYHMGIYANPELLEWFVAEYPKHCKTKLDMGKSCIRFKKPEDIPFDLIAQLATKMTPQDWIACYESAFKKQS